jgi:hypothetical protein
MDLNKTTLDLGEANNSCKNNSTLNKRHNALHSLSKTTIYTHGTSASAFDGQRRARKAALFSLETAKARAEASNIRAQIR